MTSENPATQASPARSETIQVQRGEVQLVGTLDVPALAAGARVPLVILMHGFTGSQNEPVIRSAAQSLQDAGIASIRFDFNAHGASSGQMIDMTVPNQIEDAQAIYDYARALPFVSTIGLAGHSQGGVVAAMLAGQLGDDVAALVLLAPATNIPDDARAGRVLGARFDPANPPESISLYGLQLGRDYLLTAQTLPIREVPAQFTGPVSLIQGEADALIPVSQSEDYITIFTDGEFHALPDEDHDFYRDPAQPAVLLTRFFTEHLQ